MKNRRDRHRSFGTEREGELERADSVLRACPVLEMSLEGPAWNEQCTHEKIRLPLQPAKRVAIVLLLPDLTDVGRAAGVVGTLGLRGIKIRLLTLELESLPVKRSVNEPMAEFVCDGGAAPAVERGVVAGERQGLANFDLHQSFWFKVGTSHHVLRKR